MHPVLKIEQKGFTLIEILIVIAIIAIMTVVGFVNFRSFSANQVSVKAAREIQSILKLAQTNATTYTVCNGNNPPASWYIKFSSDNKTIELRCITSALAGPAVDVLRRQYVLQNAQFALRCQGAAGDLPLPASFTYQTGTGRLSTDCPASASSINFTITNTVTSGAAIKTFKVSSGGAIDVQ